MAMAPGISAATRKRNTWLAIAVSLVLVLLLFLGLQAGGVLRLGGEPTDIASLQARGQGPSPVLQARGDGGKPTLATSRITMPDNIHDWLEHLEKCEMRKRALGKKQEEAARDTISALNPTGGMTVDDVKAWADPDATTLPVIEKASSIMREMEGPWRDLKAFFDSVPPPPECQSIADAFDQGLQDIPDQMQELDKIISGVTNPDTQEQGEKARDDAREISREHRKKIDEPFSVTDRRVQQVCDKYQTRKWFSIDAHGGNSGILGY